MTGPTPSRNSRSGARTTGAAGSAMVAAGSTSGSAVAAAGSTSGSGSGPITGSRKTGETSELGAGTREDAMSDMSPPYDYRAATTSRRADPNPGGDHAEMGAARGREAPISA